MSTYQSMHRKFWICLLVLAHLLAVLLPANRVAAAGQTEGRCGETGSQAASAATATTIASADEEVVIPKDKVDLAAFLAARGHGLTDVQRVENLILDLFIIHSDKYTGAGDAEKYREHYKELLGMILMSLGESESTFGVVYAMLSIALDTPGMATAVPYVWQDLVRGTSASILELDQELGIGKAARLFDLTDRLMLREHEIVARLFNCAREIPEVAAAYADYHSHRLHIHVLNSAFETLEMVPDLPIAQEILGRLNEDGTISFSINELKALSAAEFDKIHAAIDDIQETLIGIDKKQDVIIDYLKDQELKAKHQELMKKKAAEQQLKLDAAKSSISIVTTLVGQLDPKFAKELNVVATSALQIGVALNNWLKAVSGLKGLDKVTSLSTVVMTGNVLGAVMNIVSLFGENKPSPEQLILQEIGALRRQVDHLRRELHGRFDRIDSQLNTIYTTMHQRFGQIDLQLGRINGKLDEVQRSLIELDLKLSRIEHNTFELLNALGRRPLLEAINGGLNFEKTTGIPMPYDPHFIQFANTLHTWGTIHAFDALETGPSQTDYSDANVLAVLNSYATDSNINYFNGWLTSRGLPAITNKRVASPRDWLLASRAFTQLGMEWPEHMGRYDRQRQVDLDRVGADITKAMVNISTITTPEGPVGNHLLYRHVITNYQNKLDSVMAAIQSQVETPFLEEVRIRRLHQTLPFDLYGGVDQPLAYRSSNLDISTCGLGVLLALPHTLSSEVPSLNRYNLAEYLDLGTLASCVDAQLMNPTQICLPQMGKCYTEGMLTVSLALNYAGVTLAKSSRHFGKIRLADGEDDPTDYVVNHWEEIKQAFESGAGADTLTPRELEQRDALLAQTTDAIHNRLIAIQRTRQHPSTADIERLPCRSTSAVVSFSLFRMDIVHDG